MRPSQGGHLFAAALTLHVNPGAKFSGQLREDVLQHDLPAIARRGCEQLASVLPLQVHHQNFDAVAGNRLVSGGGNLVRRVTMRDLLRIAAKLNSQSVDWASTTMRRAYDPWEIMRDVDREGKDRDFVAAGLKPRRQMCDHGRDAVRGLAAGPGRCEKPDPQRQGGDAHVQSSPCLRPAVPRGRRPGRSPVSRITQLVAASAGRRSGDVSPMASPAAPTGRITKPARAPAIIQT